MKNTIIKPDNLKKSTKLNIMNTKKHYETFFGFNIKKVEKVVNYIIVVCVVVLILTLTINL